MRVSTPFPDRRRLRQNYCDAAPVEIVFNPMYNGEALASNMCYQLALPSYFVKSREPIIFLSTLLEPFYAINL